MFDNDAEGSRGLTEQGKKNIRFRELLDSIRLDISDTAKWGSSSTSYKLSNEDNKDFSEALVNYFEEREYDVSQKGNTLYISWVLEDSDD
ncbi:hypothetical protein I6I42_00860 [Morganella morganii]|uniref:hypothetical protein n=1 Tax=Morganella morganii TaxID=582 RepID=UPI00191D4BF5|nr:hypothetical protein [Morganella morganii]QQU41068.1 hypothetical protein I6I42_00860 [Morganella morganii]